MSKEGSVAPKERINVTFKPNANEEGLNKELPLKMLVVGDFVGREDAESIENRKTVNVNKDNFDEVLNKQEINLSFNVENKLDKSSEEIHVDLDINGIKDFGPEKIAENVPELKKLMELRRALESLKGPLGNVPEFRKAIEALLDDEESRKKVLEELDI